ncbi:MAG: alanine--tRNA ligase [Candidatus Syntrophoarchaeum sp. WYZ-LMO15]|nr:MAG: alanine--tRNA ligase [Candidatus Syntrophoarchaeum sp. WYZ-LMO15]
MLEEEYRLSYFAENDFHRIRCEKCGGYFWTRDPQRRTCGDAPCDPYSFIGSPVFEEKSLDEMREAFLRFFEKRGHERIGRYPVVARWRDDVFLTNASIYDFQPFVTSGKVPPPANPLVISQPCIRLDDLDSVGRSGRHLSNFEMMAHHAFNSKDKRIYWKEETVIYCDEFLRTLGANPDLVTYKEEPWAGGGNAGPCLEVLVGGLEIATLVFMDMELSKDGDFVIKGDRYRKMEMQIVDTGYGLERFVWLSKGSPTIYDAIFPEVVDGVMQASGIQNPLEDPALRDVFSANARLSGLINIKDKSNLTELRSQLASEIGVTLDDLTRIMTPVETIYAIVDHARCLLFMLADEIVPSNVKAGYLARLVIRRSLRLLQSLGTNITLFDVIKLHADHITAYPELKESLDRIAEILEIEEAKYRDTIKSGTRIVERILKKKRSIPVDDLIHLYDTHGIPPEVAKDVAKERGVEVIIPDNFYSLVAGMHSHEEKKEETIDPRLERVKRLPPTKKLYYEDPSELEFEAVVLDVFDEYLILDRTAFYPEGGGQPADTGVISAQDGIFDVTDVEMVDDVILHRVADVGGIKRGEIVQGYVDRKRRLAHTRHHTATHIVLHAAKKVLGEHVWQSGAQKAVDRARLDISHYKRISMDERRKIELLANEIVMEDIKVDISWLDRNTAEKRFGFTLYQGGIPAGDKIRVVRVGEDAQGCGGTHCSSTGKVGAIKILRCERIQDGIERIEFAAGEAAIRSIQEEERLLLDAANILRVPPDQLPKTASRFFEEWKELGKENERLKEALAEAKVDRLISCSKRIGDLDVVASVLDRTDREELVKLGTLISKRGLYGILIGVSDGEAAVVVTVPDDGVVKAGDIAREVSKILGGGGGGKANLGQGGGKRIDRVEAALEAGIRMLEG